MLMNAAIPFLSIILAEAATAEKSEKEKSLNKNKPATAAVVLGYDGRTYRALSLVDQMHSGQILRRSCCLLLLQLGWLLVARQTWTGKARVLVH